MHGRKNIKKTKIDTHTHTHIYSFKKAKAAVDVTG
jgi:hypothetical protein